ncbi:hypothetical protein MKX01_018459 [Papaver californicum]|nr:hypothetical protein MKX01_018459 [Papaver californicum]
MVSFEINDRKKIGLGLTGASRHGKYPLLIRLDVDHWTEINVQFFMKRQNYKGTISFGIGFFLVLIGWPLMGMILEAYGFIVLFSGFWPTLAVFLQRIPILGWIFQQPFVTSFMDKYRGRRVPV